MASDLLSDLTAAEIAITGAVTGTISRMHVCSGTSADYTVTLPAVSGNTGKLIGFRMAGIAALSKLVTLDGNASETIDGALTRVMWAGESCLLLCDGSNWFKVAGNSIAMVASMHLSANQSINGATVTKINLDTSDLDNTGVMVDTTNKRIVVKRPGTYRPAGTVAWNAMTAARALTIIKHSRGGGAVAQSGENETSAAAASNVAPLSMRLYGGYLAADYFELNAYQNSGGAINAVGGAFGAGECYLEVTEHPSW